MTASAELTTDTSLVHIQVPVPALQSSKGEEGHFTTQPVHNSACIGILASPWYQTAAHCPGMCKISLWWLFGAGVEWETCPLGIRMPTGQVLTGHLAPAFYTPWFSSSVWVWFIGGTETCGCIRWPFLLDWVTQGKIPALLKAQGASRNSFSPSKSCQPLVFPEYLFTGYTVSMKRKAVCFRTVTFGQPQIWLVFGGAQQAGAWHCRGSAWQKDGKAPHKWTLQFCWFMAQIRTLGASSPVFLLFLVLLEIRKKSRSPP